MKNQLGASKLLAMNPFLCCQYNAALKRPQKRAQQKPDIKVGRDEAADVAGLVFGCRAPTEADDMLLLEDFPHIRVPLDEENLTSHTFNTIIVEALRNISVGYLCSTRG